MNLPNETKILFANAAHKLIEHCADCPACEDYIYFGDGDFCDQTKEVIAKEMAFSDTTPTLTT